MNDHSNGNLGQILRQRRASLSLPLAQMAADTEVSQSHLNRIERGERFPSARVLGKLGKRLGFSEKELFVLAGFFSDLPEKSAPGPERYPEGLDPYVASMLAQEPVSTQRTVVGILNVLKMLGKDLGDREALSHPNPAKQNNEASSGSP